MSEINVLITNVSTVNPNNLRMSEYADANNDTIRVQGEMTNEAPIKLLIKKLEATNKELNSIILIESDDVRNKIIENNKKPEKEVDSLREDINKILNCSLNKVYQQGKYRGMKKVLSASNFFPENIRNNVEKNYSKIKLENKIKLRTEVKGALKNYYERRSMQKSYELKYKKYELNKNFENKTHINFLQNKIEDFCNENTYHMPRFEEVAITNEPTDEIVINAIMNVKEKVEYLAKDNIVNVYIESNGGVRYVMTMLIAIINVLEKTNANVRLKEIYSMVYPNREKNEDNIIKIKDTLMTYASINLLSAVDEFIHYGRIESLKKYFELRFSNVKICNSEVERDIRECLSKLESIANDLQLCRTGLIMEHFYGKDDNIYNLLNTFIYNYNESEEANAKIFLYVADVILKEYKILYSSKLDGDETKRNNLPKLIKWCIEKDYMQQAITLCSEQLPKYLIESGKIIVSDIMWKFVEGKLDSKYERNYSILVQGLNTEYKRRIIGYLKEIILWERLIKDTEDLDTAGAIREAIRQRKSSLINMIMSDRRKVLTDLGKDDTHDILNNDDEVSRMINALLNDLRNNITFDEEKYNNLLNELRGLNECIDGSGNIDNWINNSMLNKEWNTLKIWLPRHGNIEISGLPHAYASYTDEEKVSKYFEHNRKNIMECYCNKIISNEEFDAKKVFNDLFNALFGNDLESPIRNQYEIEINSYSKYDYTVYFDSDKVMIGSDLKNIKKICYLYGMCKEQRNYSNHAGNEGNSVVLNVEQLKILINYLINELEINPSSE